MEFKYHGLRLITLTFVFVSSRFVCNVAEFAGIVRTDNGGGFSSVKSNISVDATHYDGVYLDVSSTDLYRVYSVNLKDTNSIILGGIHYKGRFTIPETGKTHRILLPFSTFKAEFRGQPIPSAGPITLNGLREISVMVTKPPGSFQLTLSKLGFYNVPVVVG